MSYSQVIVIIWKKEMRAYALTLSTENLNREEHFCILHTPIFYNSYVVSNRAGLCLDL